MSDIKFTNEERETLLRRNATNEPWDFWTLDERQARRVEKLGYTVQKDHQGGWSCSIPLEKVTIRKAQTAKRKVSDASLSALQAAKRSSALDTNRGTSDQRGLAMVTVGGD